VDESSADDADYVNAFASNGVSTATDKYNFPDHSAESGTINSVKLYARCKYEVLGGVVSGYVKLNATSGTAGTQQNLTTSWAVYTQTWTTNPDDSAAWEWSDIDALIAGITLNMSALDKGNTGNSYCSQFYVEVDYTAPTGWANIKNIRAGTGSITATDVESIWFGTSQVLTSDFDQFNGATV